MDTVVTAAAILVGSVLLFLIQPLAGKALLPAFGGASAVWNLCLVFFQAVLLAGYLYAHGAVRRLKGQGQIIVHVGLCALGVLVLGAGMEGAWRPEAGAGPEIGLLSLLVRRLGLPCLVLAGSSPLLQAWYARSAPGGRFPYRLYALSNAGSLAALLAYPILIEPRWTMGEQWTLWKTGFVVFAALSAVAARFRLRHGGEAYALPASPAASGEWARWMAASAVASAMLTAVTHHLSENIAPFPLLWIVPLSLYLLSFTLCFSTRTTSWFRSFAAFPILFAALWAAKILAGSPPTSQFFALGLFLCCLFSHGDLARTRPEPAKLTSFYAAVAVGGVLGGAFVGLAAPRLFKDVLELPLSLAACCLLAWTVFSSRASRGAVGAVALASLVVLAWPYTVGRKAYAASARTFYGVLRVEDRGDLRVFIHGTVNHGAEVKSAPRTPTTYFGEESGIGRALRRGWKAGPQKVGIIGLGAGSLAVYGRKGDRYRFYELDPAVAAIAREHFTLLDGPAETDIILGDGRLSLEHERPQAFDLLAMDAFSGDAVPTHLLTKEAFRLYASHLKPGGVLAVNVSNVYLKLAPLVRAGAEVLGKEARMVETPADPAKHLERARWVLVGEPSLFADPLLKEAQPIPLRPGLRLWTDDYSNILQVLR